MTTPEEMQAHVDSLVAAIGAKVNWERHPFIGWGCVSHETPQELWMPRVETWKDYLTCLHELGHAYCKHDSPSAVMRDRQYQVVEGQAWLWAFENSIVEPTAEMRHWAYTTDDDGGLLSYLDHADAPDDPADVAFVDSVSSWLLGAGSRPGLVTA